MFPAWLDELNDRQRQAATHDDGPLLILAGAGTGKTKTLVARTAQVLSNGVAPERICLLTFTRRAAGEMLARAGRLSGVRADRVWGGTFHAVGNRLLRIHGHRIGLEPGFTVIDAGDAADLMGLVRHDVGLTIEGAPRFPRKETLAAIYSMVANTQRPLRDVLGQAFPWCADDLHAIGGVFRGYTERKRAHHLIDFDDLLLLWRALADADDGRLLAGLFDHVLVDEYQDTNRVQGDIVDRLRPGGVGLTVVGDDAQAIYSFRGATVTNILSFPERHPGTTIVPLEENYRSTNEILAVPNQVMADSPAGGFAKRLWSNRPPGSPPLLRAVVDEAAQAQAVCDAVLHHRELGIALHDQAVLFRAGHHADLLEIELARRNVPYRKFGGLRFLETAHVKDLLALLRILDNPRDELAWFRVLRSLDGIGPARARQVMAAIGVHRDPPDGPPVTPLARFCHNPPPVPKTARHELDGLREAMQACAGDGSDVSGLAPAAQVERLRRFLDPSVRRRYDNPNARIADLDQLEQLASGYTSRTRLLGDIVIDPPSSTSDLAGPPVLDDDWLTLSTVHSAKGCEWTVVHVIHANDGMFPSDLATGDTESITEERRLFYVALTRARDTLEITAPQRFYYRRFGNDDPHGYTQLSRFLSPAVLALLERHHPAATEPAGDATAAAAEAGGTATVDRYLASLWS